MNVDIEELIMNLIELRELKIFLLVKKKTSTRIVDLLDLHVRNWRKKKRFIWLSKFRNRKFKIIWDDYPNYFEVYLQKCKGFVFPTLRKLEVVSLKRVLKSTNQIVRDIDEIRKLEAELRNGK